MYKNKTAYSLAACVVLIIVITAVSYHGYHNRIFTPERMSFVVDNPEKAHAIWQEKNVRGRTLLLFDKYPHLKGRIGYEGSPQLTDANLIEFSVFANIIRKIYLIVPDAQWAEFEQRAAINPIRDFADGERGLYLYSLSGIPIIAVTPSALPQLSETALVYISNRVFNDKQAEDLLLQKKISSDILILYRGDRK